MSFERRLDGCGCCEGVTPRTPEELFNRPGLERLAYRIGTHARFKSSMLAGLSTHTRLRDLTTRQDDDFGIALLDAWAVVLDILTFYEERIANEGFLSTATERRSILELARLIGYELGPGVAAGTYLAFTLDDKPGSPEEVTLPAGTRAQSIPGQDELPQTFETSDELIARPEWSELLPRQTHPQTFTSETRVFYVQGIATQLGPGDPLLLVAPDAAENQQLVPLKVIDVETFSDVEQQVEWSRLTLDENPDAGQQVASFRLADLADLAEATFSYQSQSFTSVNVNTQMFGQSWSSGLLNAFTQAQGWPLLALGTYLFANRSTVGTAEADDGLYALRGRASAFGHNALRWATLPEDWREDLYTNDWDGETAVGTPTPTSSDVPAVNEDAFAADHDGSKAVIYLDREYPQVVEGSFVVVRGDSTSDQVFKVEAVSHASRADFGLSAKATRLTLAEIEDATPSDIDELDNVPLRTASIYTQSEGLELIELPIENDVEGQQIELEQIDLLLEPGRTVVVRGERVDLEGVIDAEAAVIASVLQVDGYTRLVLEESLEYAYKRSTTKIFANVVAATHGESRKETLGSGDGSQRFQRFGLSTAPLTHVSAPVDSGAESTAEIRVDGVLWHESPDFFRLDPQERKYVLRRDDSGKTAVLFGDGVHGARLPTGVENVSVQYRFGIGTAGHVDVDRITLLSSPPLGVREATNPVAAGGGEDPETRDDSRVNAPTTVRTLDRIVSLTDFEDYARTFGGIVKARADRVWDGAKYLTLVTVSGADGDEVTDTLMDTLRDAMDDCRDPFQPMALRNYRPLFFELEAELVIDDDYVAADVLANAEDELRNTFSFEPRPFARGLHRSEVVAVLQGVEGVVAVDLSLFRLVPTGEDEEAAEETATRLDAQPGRLAVDEEGEEELLGADLLVVTPAPLALTVSS